MANNEISKTESSDIRKSWLDVKRKLSDGVVGCLKSNRLVCLIQLKEVAGPHPEGQPD